MGKINNIWRNLEQKGIFIFLLLAIVIFAKCVVFHYFLYNQILVSSLWQHPIDALLFYYPKIFISCLIASFVFIARKQVWTIGILLAIDLWMISQLVYYNANGLLMDISVIGMAGNMKGFWSSVSALFLIQYWLLPIITIVYIAIYWFAKSKIDSISVPQWWLFALTLGGCLLLNTIEEIPSWKSNYLDNIDKVKETRKFGKYIEPCFGLGHFLPYWEVRNVYVCDPNMEWKTSYVKRTSILNYVGAMIVYDIGHKIMFRGDRNIVVDELKVQHLLNPSKTINATSNVVVILIESFESWIFDNPELARQYAPNLLEFMEQNNVFYCSHIKPEIKYGTSSDGQLIVVAGLLPISSGATTMKYGTHEFPSIFKMYEHTAIIDLTPNGSWNQKQMSKQYGIRQEIRCDHKMNDYEVFENLNGVIDTIQSPFCVLALTGATHLPFDAIDEDSCAAVDLSMDGLPKNVQDYLRCMRITDREFKHFIDHFSKDARYASTTIVVTGDHNVFKSNTWAEVDYSVTQYKLPIEESFCPLIIYSPQILQRIERNDTCYQKDIYPTIIPFTGGRNYWKGFGCDLLDTITGGGIMYKESECYVLSDAIIRSNWFNTVKDSL